MGVFLPQDDTNWFARVPAYPARLLLLSDRQLSIVAHPSSGQPAVDLPFDELVQLETGNILLLGWIQFSTSTAIYRLVYNTRASRPLDDFIAAVRRRWLSGTRHVQTAPARVFGHELDIKFRNLLRCSLDREEAVLLQYFMPPLEYKTRRLILLETEFRAGHLLALTSDNRILWLTDEHRGRCERYAGIAVSAPAWLLHSCKVNRSAAGYDLKLEFKAGASWEFCIYDPGCDCVDFSQHLNACGSDKGQITPIH